jgi:hypothetical protein
VILAVRILAGILLLAHGLVHLLYLAPDVEEFSIERSWLLPDPARRPIALVLLGATVLAFALVALSVWGLPGLSDASRVLVIIAAVVSALLLVVFWSWQLAFGLAIDVALVAVAAWWPTWVQHLVAGST